MQQLDSAQYLDAAQVDASAVAQLTGQVSLDDAYAIQHALVSARLARGERLVGAKLGFTSAAKMAQMGVSEVIAGQLTDAMQVPDGGEVALSRFIHPRIEPEVAFRICNDLDPDDPDADIEKCVDGVAPALEIIDSRYRDFRFSLADVIADNASSAGFVVGSWTSCDVHDLPVRLRVDGVVAESGSTAAILGSPVHALHAFVALARRRGFALRAGDIVLAGAATAAVPFDASLVAAEVDGLGTVCVRGVDG